VKFPVKKRFQDKFTKKVYVVGSEYQTEDQERALFLQKEGFIGDQLDSENQPKDDEQSENTQKEDDTGKKPKVKKKKKEDE
jgi:hypothetical protein